MYFSIKIKRIFYFFYTFYLFITLNALESNEITTSDNELLVITVATQVTDGFERFNRSAHIYGLNLKVLGLSQKWEGGDVRYSPGGGQKVNLLKSAIQLYNNDANKVILFVDSYDVIFTAGPKEILKRFYETGAKVLFSSEGYCWPDKSLESDYPTFEDDTGKKFLNSGGFIGYAPQIYEIVTNSDISNLDDDQLFYTKIYIDENLREKWSIKLDRKSNLFQNLNGADSDVEIRFTNNDAYIQNIIFHTNPIIIHGNGPSKTVLNSLSNYLAKSWIPNKGCLNCDSNKISLKKLKNSEKPHVLIGIFITHPTPFIDQFFNYILNLKYPKERISLVISNLEAYHMSHLQDFIDKHKTKYKKVNILPSKDMREWEVRNMALDECVKIDCDYYFSIDSSARLTNPRVLTTLIEQNKKVISPMLVRPKQVWSNFWGALTSEGFYSRSHDYIDIVKNNRKGIWNVPFISQAYLINGSLLKLGSSEPSHNFSPSYYIIGNDNIDADMAFCKILRENGIFMFITNVDDYGHLVNSDTFDSTHLHPDFYEIYTNQKDWESQYIHENYTKVIAKDFQCEQPCPDVYWFPVVSPLFCKHLIELMENFGQWSNGENTDTRLAGGYENVPTRDIHMNQIGFEQHWLYFLREYIRPVQEKLYIGYFHDPPKAIMNFVVRYHPSEQPSLRPHHDSSTYTINIALNTPNEDYEGGGCRFIRYDCSVIDLRLGWSLIHPGRLTHYHEGLKVTKGVRYIMISFVDP